MRIPINFRPNEITLKLIKTSVVNAKLIELFNVLLLRNSVVMCIIFAQHSHYRDRNIDKWLY